MQNKISIGFASGKRGIGKTSILLSFYKYICNNSIFADTNIDATDTFLLLEKTMHSNEPFFSGLKYYIDQDICVRCGKCLSGCRFGAIKRTGKFAIDLNKCEGCGACVDLCVASAIYNEENYCGDLYISETIFDSVMVYARQKPGKDNSDKLIQKVKDTVCQMAGSLNKEFIVIDCPPGIGRPLMAGISGLNLLVIIYDGSREDLNDNEKLIEAASKLKVPVVVVINKIGINKADKNMTGIHTDIDTEIMTSLDSQGIILAGIIPYDEEVNSLLNNNKLMIDSSNSKFVDNIKAIFDNILTVIK